MDTSNLPPSFVDKVQGLKGEEFVKLAEEEGIVLTDEQLEAVSGGWGIKRCPACGSLNDGMNGNFGFECWKCGHEL